MTPAQRETSQKKERRGPYCVACYWRLNRPKRWNFYDLIAECEHLFEAGESVQVSAERLGVKPETLMRYYQRARSEGLTNRVLDYRRTE